MPSEKYRPFLLWSQCVRTDAHRLSDKTSYLKILWSLEAASLVVQITVSLWNLTGGSVKVYHCRYTWQISERSDNYKYISHGFEICETIREYILSGFERDPRHSSHTSSLLYNYGPFSIPAEKTHAVRVIAFDICPGGVLNHTFESWLKYIKVLFYEKHFIENNDW